MKVGALSSAPVNCPRPSATSLEATCTPIPAPMPGEEVPMEGWVVDPQEPVHNWCLPATSPAHVPVQEGACSVLWQESWVVTAWPDVPPSEASVPTCSLFRKAYLHTASPGTVRHST